MAVVRVDRGVRLSAAAFSGARRDGGANGAALAGAGLACARPLGVPGGGSLRALGRGDRLHIHRHRGGAASLGHSAVALSVDLGAGLPTASAVAASLGADGAALRDCRHCRADGLWQHRLSAARAGRAPHRLLRDRSGEPRRTGAGAAAGGAPDDILPGAVGGRHDRRAIRRLDRAVCLLVGRRVPDLVGARRAVPADSSIRRSPACARCGGGRA